MRNNKRNKKKKKKRVLWLIVFMIAGGLFLREQYLMYKLNKVKTEYKQRYSNVMLQNKQLENQVKQSERKDYVENQARTKLGLVKTNEILFIDRNNKK